MFRLAPYLGHNTFLDQRRLFAAPGYFLRNVFGNNSVSDNIGLSGTVLIRCDVPGQELTLTGILSGSGVLTKSGDGTLAINGDNAYSGDTNIHGGSLTIGHNNALGTGTLRIGVQATVSISSTLFGLTIPNNVVTGGYPTIIGGSRYFSFAGTFSFAVNPSPGITINNYDTTYFEGPVVLSTTTSGNATAIINGTGNVTILGDMTDGPRTGGMAFRYSGTGLILLAGTNSYTGATTISGGTLRLVDAPSMSSGPGSLTLSGVAPILQLYGDTGQTFNTSKTISFTSANPTATIDLLGAGSNQTHTIGNIAANPSAGTSSLVITGSNGYGLTMGDLAFTGGNTTTRNMVNNAEGLWTIGAISDDAGIFTCTLGFSGTGNIRVTGAISDSNPSSGLLHVIKSGTNTLTLEGANTYDGNTTISGGTLGGTGFVTSNVTVQNNAGCTLRGGTGAGNAGTFTSSGTLTFAGSNGRLAVGIGSTTTHSGVAFSGAVALGGMTVNFDADALDAGTYTLITGSSMAGTVVQGTAPTGRTWTSLGIVGSNLVAVLA